MKYRKGFSVYGLAWLLYIVVGLAAVVGWVMNIMDIVKSDFSSITGLLVLRVIGVFVPPLGAVLGYF